MGYRTKGPEFVRVLTVSSDLIRYQQSGSVVKDVFLLHFLSNV